MALKAQIQQDIAGEAKAIKDYGVRKKSVPGTPLAKTLAEIQKDEKDHHRRLQAALSGLTGAKPKQKDDEVEEPDEVEEEDDEDEVEESPAMPKGKGNPFAKKSSM